MIINNKGNDLFYTKPMLFKGRKNNFPVSCFFVI